MLSQKLLHDHSSVLDVENLITFFIISDQWWPLSKMSHKDQSKVPKEEEKNNQTECSLNSETSYVFVT